MKQKDSVAKLGISALQGGEDVNVVILLGYTIAWFVAHVLFDNFY